MSLPLILQTASPRQQYAANMQQLLYATKMNEYELMWLIGETSYAWLNHFFKSTHDIEVIWNSAGFFNWWKMHWFDRDDRLYLAEIWNTPASNRVARYRQLHQEVFDAGYKTSEFLHKDFIDMSESFK